MTRDSKESGLSRWSRRKLEAKQVREALEQATPAPEIDAGAPLQPAADDEVKPVLTDADMPDLDTLNEDSDYSGFMSEGVSEELRKLALRKLFRSSVFNIRDGLDEYDEDYTTFEKLGDIVTCDMKHHIEMKELRLQEELAEAEAKRADEAAQANVDASEEVEAVEEIDDEDEDEATPTEVAATSPEPEQDRNPDPVNEK